jgi:predicted alpha/beta-fold hydrolase
MNYQAPLWLPGGNLQTIWAALYARRFDGPPPEFRRERWTTPDGDFIDVDWLQGPPGSTLLVLFHGLEGNSSSQYAQAFAAFARAQGLSFAMPHFRGCSGELNHGPRAYHSGDFVEIDWVLKRFAAAHTGRVMAAGISMGGNALMRWASEMGEVAKQTVSAVAAICSPLDLGASGQAIGRGFNRLVYTRMFLNTMKPKALAKLKQHPGLFDADKLMAARDLYEFDNVFTAPLHGFKNTEDYWARASAKPYMHDIRLPALVLNACNDPFVPVQSLPTAKDVSPHVTFWQPQGGGHVGFPHGLPPGQVMTMPQQVVEWLMAA